MKSLSDNEGWETTFPKAMEFAKVPKQLFARCSVNAICVYAALAMYRNFETNMCWPSQRRLAENVGLSKSTIKRALNELCELGIIKKSIKRFENGGIQSCIYQLCTPWATGEPTPSRIGDLTDKSADGSRVSSVATYKQEEINKKNVNDTLYVGNEIFITVCEATGVDMKNLPSAQKKKIDLAVRGLQEVRATPGEIRRRAIAMTKAWSSGKVTPKSLLDHWAEFSIPETISVPTLEIKTSSESWDLNDDGEAVPITNSEKETP